MTTDAGSASRGKRRILIILGVIAVLAIGVLASALATANGPATVAAGPASSIPAATPDATSGATASPSGKKTNPAAPLERRQEGDPFAKGRVDAPVVILEYADFTCKYCGLFAQQTLPTIVQEYVDAGKVRVEWRDLPVLSENSVHTAVAGRAAAKQGKFWEMYDAMYAHTAAGGPWSKAQTIEVAKQVAGLDLAAFTAAIDDPAVLAAVQQEGKDSRALGFNSTPMFIVGGYLLQGAQPIDAFRQTIERALEDAG